MVYKIPIIPNLASFLTFFLLSSYFFALIALEEACNIALAGGLFMFDR